MFGNFVNETTELQAKAGLPGEKPGHYYRAREEDGELIEQIISPEGVEERTVATGVKEGTPAVYLPRKTQRVILALGPDDELQYYTCQNDADDWDDEAKQISNVTNLHPQTALAAGYTNKATHVFYQDTRKNLCCAETSDFNSSSWTLSGPLTAAVKPAGGTPLKTFATGLDELRLYYCSEDGYLHYLAFTEGAKTEDHRVSYANFGESASAVTSFILRSAFDNGSIRLFALNEDNTLVIYAPTGKTLVGTLLPNGDLDLFNKQESGAVYM